MNHHANTSPSVVLTIAGFDPSSGAGISADLKPFAAHNCYGVAALTALTVQNTQGARAVHAVEPAVLKESVACLFADARGSALKIGMLGTAKIAEAVSEIL